MSEDLIVWTARLLYLAIFVLAGMMARRAWKVAVRRDLARVTDFHGRPLPQPARWAGVFVAINLTVTLLLLAVAVLTLLLGLSFPTWTGLVAFFVWMYYLGLQLLAHHAGRQAEEEA